jgi:hypothetical protein
MMSLRGSTEQVYENFRYLFVVFRKINYQTFFFFLICPQLFVTLNNISTTTRNISFPLSISVYNPSISRTLINTTTTTKSRRRTEFSISITQPSIYERISFVLILMVHSRRRIVQLQVCVFSLVFSVDNVPLLHMWDQYQNSISVYPSQSQRLLQSPWQ